mmetsp:Transcript_4401/g.8974  ORF Transcript_4401/g.8974 Transcript_4401/m.8974 type:complete len:106 (-) Transcript_4401:1081-1398(-)
MMTVFEQWKSSDLVDYTSYMSGTEETRKSFYHDKLLELARALANPNKMRRPTAQQAADQAAKINLNIKEEPTRMKTNRIQMCHMATLQCPEVLAKTLPSPEAARH